MLPLAPASYEMPRMSPDGKQIALTTSDGRDRQISVYELSSGTTLRRLTFGRENSYPVWSPDGRNIFFRSSRDGNSGIFRQLADGTGSAERLIIAEGNGNLDPTSVDPSGKTLAFEAYHRGDFDILMLPLEGDRKPYPFVELPGSFQGGAVFSPDGQWVAYVSAELNRQPEIFVQPYPGTGAKYQITTDGGEVPIWSPDGKQLYYYLGTKLFAVDIRTQPTFSFGKPSPLPISGAAQPPGTPRNYDITPDGKRFLVVLPANGSSRSNLQINVVLNWFRELQERVPVK
jgi:Tol biopolymer transport system component